MQGGSGGILSIRGGGGGVLGILANFLPVTRLQHALFEPRCQFNCPMHIKLWFWHSNIEGLKTVPFQGRWIGHKNGVPHTNLNNYWITANCWSRHVSNWPTLSLVGGSKPYFYRANKTKKSIYFVMLAHKEADTGLSRNNFIWWICTILFSLGSSACSDNHCSDNYCSDNHCSDNHCSDNHCSDNHCSDNYCSDNHCSDAENGIFDIQ